MDRASLNSRYQMFLPFYGRLHVRLQLRLFQQSDVIPFPLLPRPPECERCGKSGTPRQQFSHMGVTICFVCARERSDELVSEGSWAAIPTLRRLAAQLPQLAHRHSPDMLSL